ncbi:MarR family transcriptional regulator [Streptomyces sp. NPDC048106]|uniref:MarR family winged helix-turn-helix transcriptional regulator n=1 Tax=Streptomyces sp. NPDC048106 TaxID=3155750 RepID=UPI003452CC80
MENKATGPQSAAPPSPVEDGHGRDNGRSVDQDLLDGWRDVVEGFHATNEALVSELAERFNVGRGPAGVLLRLLTAPGHRMPMTRLAHEAGMSSGGFTKLADRLCADALARRVACEDDRRVTYLELTDEGQHTAQAISQAATEILSTRVLAPLGPDGFRKLTETMRALRDANSDPRK